MPAISKTIAVREAVSHIAKRSNWAAEEPGVIVVLCIVFVVACGLIGLWISKQLAARKARKQQQI